MAVSLMAARLFENAFKNFDFTGWPEFQDFGTTKAAHMMLSTDKKDMNMYSIIVNARETPEGIGYTFTLLIEQVAEEIHDNRYQFLVKDIAIHDVNGLRKIGISVGRGQDIILDVLDRPAYKPELDEEEEKEEPRYFYRADEPKSAPSRPKGRNTYEPDDDDEEEEEEDEDAFDEYERDVRNVVKTMECPECGAENPTEYRVCKNCGAPLIVETPVKRKPTPPIDDDDEDEEEEVPQKISLKDRLAAKKANKRVHRDLLGMAKRRKAPKGKATFANHRRP